MTTKRFSLPSPPLCSGLWNPCGREEGGAGAFALASVRPGSLSPGDDSQSLSLEPALTPNCQDG